MGDDDSSFWREGGSELERERVEVVVGETSPFSMTESILKERLRPSDLDPMDDGVQRRGGGGGGGGGLVSVELCYGKVKLGPVTRNGEGGRSRVFNQ